jgi:hypothetical protein
MKPMKEHRFRQLKLLAFQKTSSVPKEANDSQVNHTYLSGYSANGSPVHNPIRVYSFEEIEAIEAQIKGIKNIA